MTPEANNLRQPSISETCCKTIKVGNTTKGNERQCDPALHLWTYKGLTTAVKLL